MNNKGFTLVELLATIVILSLISVVTGVIIVQNYKDSQDKAEEAFEKQLIGNVEQYIAMYGGKLSYDIPTSYYKCSNIGECVQTYLFTADTTDSDYRKIGDIISEFSSKDAINPKTNVKCTNENTELKIYRDSDYVYCFTIKPDVSGSCITIDDPTDSDSIKAATISTCEGIYKVNESDANYISFK